MCGGGGIMNYLKKKKKLNFWFPVEDIKISNNFLQNPKFPRNIMQHHNYSHKLIRSQALSIINHTKNLLARGGDLPPTTYCWVMFMSRLKGQQDQCPKASSVSTNQHSTAPNRLLLSDSCLASTA